MRYKTILLTGSSGKLGKELLSLNWGDRTLLTPTRAELDITYSESVAAYIKTHAIDAVIHCAALTNMQECEKNPSAAIEANIKGTANLVQALPNTRFVYLSTDYVYPCIEGPYSEQDPTLPFNLYAWSKLGGECAVKTLKNHCIIRTSFFNPNHVPFDTAPSDVFCSKISFMEGAKALLFLLDNIFVGTINVGRERISMYDLLKPFRSDMRAVTLEEVNRQAPMKRAPDSSLDVRLWNRICTKNS